MVCACGHLKRPTAFCQSFLLAVRRIARSSSETFVVGVDRHSSHPRLRSDQHPPNPRPRKGGKRGGERSGLVGR